MICCGKERTGNFCDECGKQLVEDAGLSLLQHAQQSLKRANFELNRAKKTDAHAAYVEDKQNLVEKWTRWVEFIRSAIERAKK